MTKIDAHELPPATTGLILHRAALYDFTVWLMSLGRERVFRDRILQLARPAPGESMLDVGCGTGTLAVAAKRRVGSNGKVTGIDASPEMLARAERKAAKAGLEVVFQQAAAQMLPFPDAQFDVVCTTLMLHHLPGKARHQCAREMARVLKVGGRLLAVDFAAPAAERWPALRRLHRHGHVKLENIGAMLEGAGLKVVDSGALNYRNMHFSLATKSDR